MEGSDIAGGPPMGDEEHLDLVRRRVGFDS